MNRRAFLRIGGYAGVLFVSTPAWCAEKSKQGLNDGEVLSQAGPRIEKHRKGEGLVAVRSDKGMAIPGVSFRIEQLSHDFLFGCNCFLLGRCENPDREAQYRQQFTALLNYCTTGFYWATYEPQQGRPDYGYTDSVVEWTRRQGITCKGHPLVWDHPAGSPKWLPEDKAQIQRLSNERVRDIVSRYRDRINVWDVVNEATHLRDKVNKTKMAELGLSLGPVAYTSTPLKVARTANPRTLLLVNDYRTDQAYYNLLKNLRQYNRFLFDVIGIQSHMHSGVWPLRQVWEISDRFSSLGRPIHFTETTILSGRKSGSNWGETTPEGEAAQAESTVNFYRTVFAHPAVQALTWWDFSDYHAWQGAPAGWLRKDMSPKPVYQRLMDLIKGEWWTRIEGRTGPRGNFITRAFYGKYRITVEPPNRPPITREVRWQRGQPNQFVFQV